MAERILEVCKVVPLQGSPTDLSLPLTFFDLSMLQAPQPEVLFFYETPFTESFLSGSIVPKLKHSLSLTLQHFLPLSGHLTWPSSFPNPVVLYKVGDGVSFTVAVSDADFHHLSGRNIRECRIFSPLFATLVGSDSEVTVLALKVTLFPNKGICICVTVHHAVFDAKSLALFVNLWASISKFGGIKEDLSSQLTLVFERKFVRERYAEIECSYIEFLKQNGVAQNSLAIKEFVPPTDKVRGTFELSGLEVRRLKELVRNRVSYVSTMMITYAYVVLCMVKTTGLASKRVCLMLPVDIRGRLAPPLPANYFGNCLGCFIGILDTEELLRKDGMWVIVNCISKIMESVNENDDNGVLKWVPYAFQTTNPTVTGTARIAVSSSSRLGFQGIDFGWGRPKKMDIALVDKMTTMTITEVEGGIVEVELSLNKHEMECFSYEFSQGLKEMMKHRLSSM